MKTTDIVALVVTLAVLVIILALVYYMMLESACFRVGGTVVRVPVPEVYIPHRRMTGWCPINSLRIINGAETAEEKYPWAFRLLNVSGGTQCGASLVNDRWLLTAAHCLTPDATVIVYRQNASRTVDFISIHPLYDDRCTLNDIALVRVSEPFSIDGDDDPKPVCLPVDDYDLTRVPMTAIGWGSTGTAGFSERLREAVVYELSYCNVTTKPESQICTEGLAGERQSLGDSGSSLTISVGGTDVIVGVSSYGPRPVVSTRVYPYLDWIIETING